MTGSCDHQAGDMRSCPLGLIFWPGRLMRWPLFTRRTRPVYLIRGCLVQEGTRPMGKSDTRSCSFTGAPGPLQLGRHCKLVTERWTKTYDISLYAQALAHSVLANGAYIPGFLFHHVVVNTVLHSMTMAQMNSAISNCWASANHNEALKECSLLFRLHGQCFNITAGIGWG